MTAAGTVLPCLRIGLVIYFPYMTFNIVGEPRDYSGVMMEVNSIIAAKLNRCIEYVIAEHPTGGVQTANGSWIGAVGLLLDHDVDFVGVPTTVNDQRLKVVDYSVYVDMDKQVIIYKRPSLEANIAGFVKPFNKTVWALVAAALVLVCVATWFVYRSQDVLQAMKSRKTRDSNSNAWSTSCLWSIYVSLSQSSPWWPEGGALRVVAGTWMLMMLILATVYRSNLKAMLIIPKIRLPFNNMEEMLQTNIPCFVPLGSILHLLMEKAPPKSQLDRLKKQAVIHLDPPQAVRDIITGKYAAITNNHNINYVLNTAFEQTKSCQNYVADEAYITGFSASLGIPKHSPLTSKINRILESLQESGVIRQLYHNILPYAFICLRPESFRRPNNNLRPLELEDFYGVLSIYAGGTILAGLVLVLEFLTATIGISYRRDSKRCRSIP
ncbi:glutamate [NMDA] receptor subunit 1-like [Scylla paramamosain]|uniref:glutamate [NMDA] receptor subunit 1-like n=1 Tax=Scylla paramamosain TaxID=85552 RepID=UPI00308345C8